MTTEKEDEPESAMERLLKRLIPWIGGLMVFALGLYFVWFSSAKVSHDSGDWGTLGDYFGGLMNPVISFATLLIAYAVWQLQREELKATKKALKDQANTAEQQRQEQRFFDLLNTYYRTVDSLRFDKRSIEVLRSAVQVDSYFGKEAIRVWLSSYVRFGEFLQAKGQYVANSNAVSSEANQALLTEFGLEWGGSSEVSDRFGPYLRTVDKLLATANLVLTTHKQEYLQLFRAQLSNSELALIGYQVLLGQEGSELQKNVEQFGLLAALSHGDLRSALSDRLSASAFTYSIEPAQ